VTVGIKLIVEVLDNAPSTLTSGERMVLTVIAEWANDNTREARQSRQWTLDRVAYRAGLKRSGLKAVFQGLARKGCEVRLPIGETKAGEPIYAFEGTAMTFRIPHFPERGDCGIPSEGWPQHLRGDAVASERGGHGDPLPLNSPHKSPHVTDQNSPASSRFAPSSGGAQIPSQRATTDLDDVGDGSAPVEIDTNEPYDRLSVEHFTAARAEDRHLFRALVGDRLQSDGSKFTKGVWDADQFYTAFRKWKKKRPIEWPGKMLQRIADDNPGDGGVEDWLIYLGLETV
jgi:hypothetical protein